MLVVDFDDWHEHNHAFGRLQQLKEANPAFKCTLFAVPGLGSERFWASVPDWCQLAVHGWLHPSPYECADWTRERMEQLMDEPIVEQFFVQGFKAPGWQISDGCYEALLERDWWVADQHLEDHRRPLDLRCHLLGDGQHWHGHVQNVCGNGIEETWEELLATVVQATDFQFVSEAAR